MLKLVLRNNELENSSKLREIIRTKKDMACMVLMKLLSKMKILRSLISRIIMLYNNFILLFEVRIKCRK